jgi:hypothetical protein
MFYQEKSGNPDCEVFASQLAPKLTSFEMKSLSSEELGRAR